MKFFAVEEMGAEVIARSMLSYSGVSSILIITGEELSWEVLSLFCSVFCVRAAAERLWGRLAMNLGCTGISVDSVVERPWSSGIGTDIDRGVSSGLFEYLASVKNMASSETLLWTSTIYPSPQSLLCVRPWGASAVDRNARDTPDRDEPESGLLE